MKQLRIKNPFEAVVKNKKSVAWRGLILLVILSFLFSACGGAPKPVAVAPVTGLPAGTDGFPWWNDTTFYEIFVRSFYDSNADGIGDFNGITTKLDYLKNLGVNGIWLMPIFPSPSTHGYDVTDYYNVNPQYGTLDDFKHLLSEAHKRGIKVILDMVFNHTSTSNPWFKDASSDPNSPKRNWYIWSDKDPNYTGPWGEQVWYPTDHGYYYAIFDQSMPDLNYKNPEVVAEMEKVTSFWLKDVGVDGFRLDAAKHIVEDGQIQDNSQLTHDWWKEFRPVYKADNPQAMTVGEVWSSTDIIASYTQGDQLDLAFEFNLASTILKSVDAGTAFLLPDAVKTDVSDFKPSQFATFLTNHDIARTMTTLGEDVDKAKLAASILLTLPGVPFIYYGEEIGLTGNKPDPDIRAPMQWSTDANAGFTTADYPWELLKSGYDKAVNVTTELADKNSLLNHYQALIGLRNQHAALRVGDYIAVDCDNSAVMSFLRVSKGETVLVVINLSKDPISGYKLSLRNGPLTHSYQAVSLLGGDALAKDNLLPSLTANAAGGFDSYLPTIQGQSLPGNFTLIIQLQAKK